MAVTVPNRFFPGSLTDADDVNENFDTLTAYINSTLETTATHNSDVALLPKGKVAYATTTTATGSITTAVVDLTGLSVTFTALASRYYKITGWVLFQTTVADDSFAVFIRDGSGTQLQQASQHFRLASVTQFVSPVVVIQPGAGSKTYKLSAQRLGGTGTGSTAASATFPSLILVEDIGL